MFIVPFSCTGGRGFKSSPGDCLSWLTFRDFLQSSEVPGELRQTSLQPLRLYRCYSLIILSDFVGNGLTYRNCRYVDQMWEFGTEKVRKAASQLAAKHTVRVIRKWCRRTTMEQLRQMEILRQNPPSVGKVTREKQNCHHNWRLFHCLHIFSRTFSDPEFLICIS